MAGWETHTQPRASLSSKRSPFYWKFLQNSVRTDARINSEYPGDDPSRLLRSSRFLFLIFDNQSQVIKINKLTLITGRFKKYNSFPHYLLLNNNSKLYPNCTKRKNVGAALQELQHCMWNRLFCTQRQQGDGWLSPTQLSNETSSELVLPTSKGTLYYWCRTKTRTWPRATACEKLNKEASSKQFRKLVGGFPFFWVIFISSRQ